jgi:hypothetical protein
MNVRILTEGGVTRRPLKVSTGITHSVRLIVGGARRAQPGRPGARESQDSGAVGHDKRTRYGDR